MHASSSLTLQKWDGVSADGVQGHWLLAIFGAAALVLLLSPEEGAPGRRRQSFTRAVLILHVSHTVSAIELLIHPEHTQTHMHACNKTN